MIAVTKVLRAAPFISLVGSLLVTASPSAPAQQVCGAKGCPTMPNEALTRGGVRTTSKAEICSRSTKLIRNVPASEKQEVFDRYHYPHSRYAFDGVAPASVPLATIHQRGWSVAGPEIETTINPDAPGKPGPGNSEFEVDHLISLELGGDNSLDNLWPESYLIPWGAHVKDVLENRLHKLVCNGKISVEEAQTAIRTNWIAAYHRYVEGNEPRF